MAQTAPQGYGSNYAAILDLIRFGYGIWTPSQMAVLLFHAERSTAMGRDADQHSESQATEGIYSSRQLAWVRGPAGVSRATWHRANNELEIDAAQPSKTPNGVLRRIRRKNKFGKDDATEYEIDWPAIKARIENWKESRRSQNETLSVSPRETQSLTARHSHTDNQSTRIRGSHSETHSQSDFGPSQESVGHSPRAREAPHPSAAAIAAAIEQASGERPRTDGLIDQILAVGQKLDLPEEALIRWIHDKCFDVRSRGYPLSAGLLGKAVGEDIIPWVRKNANFVSQCQRRRDLERSRQAEVQPIQKQAAGNPQFASDLLAEVLRKRKGAHA